MQQDVELLLGLARQRTGQIGFDKGLGFLGLERRNVHRDDEFGQPVDLAAGDDQHIGAVLGDRFFVGAAGVTGEDAFEFHVVLTQCVLSGFSGF